MGSLGESVIGAAQAQAQGTGQTVGNAVQAYHIAATAEHARQELDMEKQKQDINKANWVSQQYDKIGRTSGPAQNMLIDSFGKQAQQIIPGFNPDTLEILKKDPDALRAITFRAAHSLSRGGVQTPEDAQALLALHNGDLDGFTSSVTKMGEENAQISAAQLKNQALEGRVQTMQDNAVTAAVRHIHESPAVKNLVTQDQSLAKARGILNDPNHTPSWIELDESMQDAAKVLNGGSVSSDMKLKQLQAGMFDKSTGHLKGFLSSDPNQPANPQSIAFANHFIGRLSGQIDGQLAQSAGRLANGLGSQYYHNPNIHAATTDAIKSYQNGSWRSNPGLTAAPTDSTGAPQGTAAAPTQNPTPYGTTPKEIEANYQAFLAQKAHKQAGGN